LTYKTATNCSTHRVACILAILAAATGTAMAQQPTANTLQPQALAATGIYQLQAADPNLTGDGIAVAVVARSITYLNGQPQNDYRPAVEHKCLENAELYFHDQQLPPAGTSSHSTAICSMLFGRDPNASYPNLGQFTYQGLTPNARADVYEFWHFLSDYVFAGSPPDVNVITAGFGSPFEDWWTRGIDSLAEHYGLVVVAGIGNGSDASDPVLHPGAAANTIGVGLVDALTTDDTTAALSKFPLARPQHSSKGPTEDTRCKPDIVAPGNCLAADYNRPDKYIATGNWSSFATPLVAGTAGLLTQKATHDPNLRIAAGPNANCIIKAILINSATKLPYWHKGRLTHDDDELVPLDYVQGAGMLNALAAYDQLTAGIAPPDQCPTTAWDLNHLALPDSPANIYRIKVDSPAGKTVTITAVWNKHYSDSYPFELLPEKDTNLRLEIWALDTTDPNNDYPLASSDSPADNLEHIYVPLDPNFTNYEIVIAYSNPEKSGQPQAAGPYALAWNVGNAPTKDLSIWCDLNSDGLLNDLDVTTMLDSLMAAMDSPDSYLLGDINDDGQINVDDLKILIDLVHSPADQLTE